MPESSGIDVAFPARAESAGRLRHELRRFLELLPLEEECIDDVILAAGEAAGNAIEHAYRGAEGSVRLSAFMREGCLVVEVRDAGRWRLDGEEDRGRGLAIMRALVDRVEIESTREGTSVRLERSIARRSSQGAG
jgi:anti-sigma regulatory factor (Ser/Thr protein kinase)